MANNNGTPWGPVKEVDMREIPPPVRGKSYGLYEDLVLRLEQTDRRFALAVPFSDSKEALRAGNDKRPVCSGPSAEVIHLKAGFVNSAVRSTVAVNAVEWQKRPPALTVRIEGRDDKAIAPYKNVLTPLYGAFGFTVNL